MKGLMDIIGIILMAPSIIVWVFAIALVDILAFPVVLLFVLNWEAETISSGYEELNRDLFNTN